MPSYLSAVAMDIALDVANGKNIEQHQLIDPPYIPAEDAEEWYVPTQSDEFMPVYTDDDNT